ncbi:head GIN domain-containing protein [Anaeromyxobacter sp. PSR-1]|uniref:head GIN domain-containing protein n=1 Tax=Anaeromyxobacter sp. PSR-1 TaxID=1300915 RepID=UPI0005E203DD|nr:head GIN domain-containing protein [Anaeromyxobacter sp. PSR-1]GAO04492.1 hypothetical protein PSR1_03386 [Anaeromyxobacter sp. PSR-1]
MRLAALAAAAALTAPLSAAAVDGDGHVVHQRREVPAFQAIQLAGSLDLEVKVGPAQSVVVVADENLQPEIVTEVRGGTLTIRNERDLRSYRGPRVEVTVPALERLALAGSGSASVDGARGDQVLSMSGSGHLRWTGTAGKLRVELTGSGSAELDGRADRLDAAVKGSGEILGRRLAAHDAAVQIAGSGDAEVTLSGGTLRAAVSGSGDVRWWGEGRVEQAAVAGSGRITRG